MSTLTVVPNYKPHPKQMMLHRAPTSFEDISITLFGGSRGSGKSAGILADAFMFATTYPGAKCVIFREKLDAVKQSFLDKLPTLFPQFAEGIKLYDWKEKSSSWYPSRSIVFPNGSYITLQRVANATEAKAFRGWEFHYLAVDECTLVEEEALDFLFSCVRSAVVQNKYTKKPHRIPTKIVYGCNPGGISHRYIKEKYIDTTVTKYDPVHNTPIETKDHQVKIPHPLEPNTTITQNIRFIPASYKDNPFISPSYIANLMNGPQHTVERDLYGNWEIVAGRMFDLKKEQLMEYREAKAVLDKEENAVEIFISIDWGFRPSFHSAHWHAVLEDKRVITFREMYAQDLIFEDFVDEIAKKSHGMHISGTLLPHDLFRQGDRYRDNTGKIIGETKADVFENAGLNPISVDSGKGKVQMRYDKLHSAVEMKHSDGVYKFRITKNCENLIKEFEDAVYDENKVGEIAKGCRDHALDDFGLFLIFYSDDICPIGFEAQTVDNRSKIQRMLDEEEEYLNELAEEEETIIVDNLY